MKTALLFALSFLPLLAQRQVVQATVLDYPPELRLGFMEGPATIRVTINKQGRVEQARAIAGNSTLASVAERDVMGYVFTPAQANEPETAEIDYLYEFILDQTLEGSRTEVNRTKNQTKIRAGAPLILRSDGHDIEYPPEALKQGAQGKIKVSFGVATASGQVFSLGAGASEESSQAEKLLAEGLLNGGGRPGTGLFDWRFTPTNEDLNSTMRYGVEIQFVFVLDPLATTTKTVIGASNRTVTITAPLRR